MNTDITVIHARWIVPVVPRNTTLEHHALVIENGRILDLLQSELANTKYASAKHIERKNHVLMPGLINAHTHAAMSLFRGLADDLPLMEWLSDHIWPAEAQWVNGDFMRDGVELAIAEMLLSGTTCFNDMYFFPDSVARSAQELGIRAFVGIIMIDFPTAWGSGPDEYLSKGIQVHDEVRSLSRVNTTLAPHSPYTVSDGPLEQVRTYADELHVPVHMHIHETEHEVNEAFEKTGKRPLERLNDLGLLNPRMMAVHMTQLTDEEIALSAQQGISIVHCPESNMKLASGFCRVNDLLKAGTNVCLGTDSASSNNDLDMFSEMQTAALIGKAIAKDAKALPAWQVLEMATINGAKALNVESQIGSLEITKAADFIAVDLSDVSTQPVYDPVSHIVYSASREQVSDTWVNGKQLVADKQLTKIDLNNLLDRTQAWGEKIALANKAENNEHDL